MTTADLEPMEQPDVELVMSDPDRMEPGYTLVPRWGSDGLMADSVVALDSAGNIVYLLRSGIRLTDAVVSDDGLRLLVGYPSLEIQEVDWLGRLARGFHSAAYPGEGIAVEAAGRFHHDAVPMGDGGYVVLSKRVRPVENFPLSYDDLTDTATVNVAEDVLERFGPDGAIVWTRPLGDLLDLTRIGFDSLNLSREDGAPDWAHANAVWMDPDGHFGVSLRHQDAVVRLDPVLGTLDWILGTPTNWKPPWSSRLLTPIGAVEWPSHQHAAHRDWDGAISLFDNGNARASPSEVPYLALPPEAQRRSMVSRFSVDPEGATVAQVRSLDLGTSVGRVFSEALGDADLLPNGNVLAVFGRIVAEDGVYNTDLGYAPFSVRIVEWDPTGAEVFHVHLTTDPESLPSGWDSYRVQRFAEFPGG